MQLLVEYNNNPYNIDLVSITIKNIYDMWLPWKMKTTNISKKSISRYTNAILYYKDIWSFRFIDITLTVLQVILDNCPYGYSTKSDIKVLYSQLFTYAKQIDIPIKKNASESVFIGKNEKSSLHFPFTEEEINILWENLENIDFVSWILIDIYTGFRPTELLNPKEINLEKKYIISGIKTEAGIDRTVPIHNRILPLVKNKLIDKFTKISYNKFNLLFSETMNTLKFKHTPYDCRHTFATRADKYGMNKLCIKIIMGHAITDITDNVYTHKHLNDLKKEINKLK